jgi:quinol monooxygenase YgiN
MKADRYAPADLNDGFVVAAKPGEEEKLAKRLEAMIEPTTAEPGVKLFLPYRSPTDPKAFFIYELYVDEADWAANTSRM